MKFLHRIFPVRARHAKPKISAGSALAVVREMLGEPAFQEILLQCPDRREILMSAALSQGVAEYDFLETVAIRLGLPFVRKIADAGVLPPGISFADLRSSACVPIFAKDSIAGLVCVDPGFVSRVIGVLGNLPLKMATWNEVRQALENMERKALEAQSEQRSREAAELNKLATEVCAALIAQVDAHAQSNFQVFDAGHELTYEFFTREGRSARGVVRGIGRDALVFALDDAHLCQRALSITCTTRALQVRVERMSPVRYLLSWGGVSKKEPPKVENVIPFPPPSAIDTESDRQVGEPSLQETPRDQVLIVDDNGTFVRVLERFFDRHDLSVQCAGEGGAALEILSSMKSSVSLVLCDVHMPGVNGPEFLKRLRSKPQFRLLPVVMLTSDSDFETKLKLLEQGADAVVTKNEDPRLLCIQVKRLISKHKMVQAA